MPGFKIVFSSEKQNPFAVTITGNFMIVQADSEEHLRKMWEKSKHFEKFSGLSIKSIIPTKRKVVIDWRTRPRVEGCGYLEDCGCEECSVGIHCTNVHNKRNECTEADCPLFKDDEWMKG